MRKIILILTMAMLFVVPLYAEQNNEFYVLKIHGIIDAANSDYAVKGIEKAEKDGAAGVILEMDTPGGLMKSMRKIIEKILISEIPIITYVTPKGARAASAGTFILLSSHVAAMAEGTNIGTASPIDLKGNKASEKITNDSIAYIKNLARMNNRNEDWAKRTITENISTSEIDAKKEKVIEIIATDIDDLLKQLDGKKIKINEKDRIIITKNYTIKRIALSPKHKFLHYLTDPNVSYILFMVGIYGIIYELANPGTFFPGIAGGISLVLAFIGFESIPIDIAGIILIVLAVVLFVAEALTSAFGILFAGGSISLIIGSIILFPGRDLGEAWAPSVWVIVAVSAFTIVFFALIVWLVIKAHKRIRLSGKLSTVGRNGIAETPIHESGIVNVGGEEWQAFSDEKIEERDIIEVLEEKGLKLKVKKIPRKKEEE